MELLSLAQQANFQLKDQQLAQLVLLGICAAIRPRLARHHVYLVSILIQQSLQMYVKHAQTATNALILQF